MLSDIKRELRRLDAPEITVTLDDEFEPQSGPLVLIESKETYWHMLPEHFQQLLAELPDGAGSDSIHRTIEMHGVGVWHGPAPKDSLGESF